MPFSIYGCTWCDYSGFSAVLWGYHFYQHGQVELSIPRVIGWCRSCNKVVAVEDLQAAKGQSGVGAGSTLRGKAANCDSLIEALTSRVSGPRCLSCGSEDCEPLPPHYSSVAGPIGFIHPGCSGELTIKDWMRGSAGDVARAYDLEGNFLLEKKTKSLRETFSDELEYLDLDRLEP